MKSSASRRETSSSESAWAAGLAIVAAALCAPSISGCGSKTGLWVPCEIPVVPSTAQVVVIIDHSTFAAAPYSGIIPDGGGVIYLAEFGPIVAGLAQSLPSLDADPLAPTATGLYVFPEVGQAAVERDGFCATPPNLLLSIAPRGATAVVNQLHLWDDGSGNYWNREDLRPIGGVPVYAALRIARTALDATPGPAPRFIVLMTTNATDCNAALRSPATCECFDLPQQTCLSQPPGVETCSDARRVLATLAAFRADGVKTLIVSDDFTNYAPGGTYDSFRVAAAQTGGLEQAGPHPWYGVRQPVAITQALHDRVAPAGWCQPRAQNPPHDPEEWALHSMSVGRVPRDVTHVEGWDWINAAAGTLQLFGTACDAAMRNRGGLTLVAERLRCLE